MPHSLFLFLVFLSAPTSASDFPIPLEPRSRKLYAEELRRAGEFQTEVGSLAHSRDGEYIYLVAAPRTIPLDQIEYEDLVVVTSPRVPNTDVRFTSGFGRVERYLATHRSLLSRLRAEYPWYRRWKERWWYFAAGEYLVRNLRVSWVNNRSGTFWGEAKHLDFAVRVLKRRGLPIEEGTARFVVDGKGQDGRLGHGTALIAARLEVQVAADQERLKLRGRMVNLHSELERRYPVDGDEVSRRTRLPGFVDTCALPVEGIAGMDLCYLMELLNKDGPDIVATEWSRNSQALAECKRVLKMWERLLEK